MREDSLAGTEQYSYIGHRALEWISSVLEGAGSEGDIIDIGCGNGWITCEISRRLKRGLIGVDLSTKAIDLANGRLDTNGTRFLVGSFYRLPIQPSSVTAVVAIDSIQHASEHSRLVGELSRICMSNAALISTSWMEIEDINALKESNSLCRLLVSSGFDLHGIRDLDPNLEMQFRVYAYAKANQAMVVADHGKAFLDSLMEEARRLWLLRGKVAHVGLFFRRGQQVQEAFGP